MVGARSPGGEPELGRSSVARAAQAARCIRGDATASFGRAPAVADGTKVCNAVPMAPPKAGPIQRSWPSHLLQRFCDWQWPAALAAAYGIVLLGRSESPYRIGSVTYYANTIGLPLFLALLVFAGFRWCWLGRRTEGTTAPPHRLVRLAVDLPGLALVGWVFLVLTMVLLAMVGLVEL